MSEKCLYSVIGDLGIINFWEGDNNIIVTDIDLIDRIVGSYRKDNLAGNSFMNFYSPRKIDITDVVTGGQLKFYFNDVTKKPYVYTTYKAERTLTDLEEKELMDYTRGQLTDGVGEGYGQIPAFTDYLTKIEYFIEPFDLKNGEIRIKKFSSDYF